MHTHRHHRHGEVRVTKHVFDLIAKDAKESCPQRTDEWFQKREKHLTASAIATACGANPYEKRSTLIKRKTGRDKAFTGNIMTAHGNKYEQEAIEKYERMSGEKVIEFGLLESLNKGEEFIAGSPDGITASGRCIEVKCPFKRKPTSVVPDHYMYQIQTVMHILRLPVCDFIQYIPETHWVAETFIVTVVPYDTYFWAAKFPLISLVWQEILDIRELQRRGVFVDSDDDGEEHEDTSTPSTNAITNGITVNIKREFPMLIDVSLPSIIDTTEIVTVTEADGTDLRWKNISSFFDNALKAVDNGYKPSGRALPQSPTEMNITF